VIGIHQRLCLVAAIVAGAGLVRAEPAGEAQSASPSEPVQTGYEVIEVTPVRDPDRERALERPAFVTVVRVDDRALETTSVAEVLAESVGVRVRSLGGLGSFSSLSMRGTGSGNTAVLVDGVPLSTLASATWDLSRFELLTLSRVEVYRGQAPAAFGSATLGGAVNLVTRIDPGPAGRELVASFGTGSFGARHALVRALARVGTHGLSLQGAYRRADGDFVYRSDNGTNLNPADDRDERRTNNGFEQVDLVVRTAPLGDDGAAFGSRFLYKNQGIPGFGTAQTTRTSLGTMSNLVDGTYRRQWRRPGAIIAFTGGGFSYLERSLYSDVDNEVGLGAQDRRYLTLASGARGSLGYRTATHLVEAGIDARIDRFDERELDMENGRETRGLRPALGFTAGDSLSLAEGALVVAPGLRFDLLHTRPTASGNDALGVAPEARTDLFLSPRLAARWRLRDELSLKANGGFYFRPPTLLEMFGDRGFVVGNPNLVPETGLAGDLGVVASSARGPSILDRLFLEAAGFASRADDVIVFSANAGGFTGAVNLDAATIVGGEVAASARVARVVTLTGNYTWMWTRRDSAMASTDGKELPQRPRHQLYGRADAVLHPFGRQLTLWADTTLISHTFVDTGNRDPIPRRLFVGIGAKAEVVSSVAVGFEAKNVFDERVEAVELSPAPSPELSRVPRAIADFFGYPLPGRALYATVEMKL